MSLLHNFAALALRALDPETAHEVTLAALRAGLGPQAPAHADPILATELAGLRLSNPIGLAAGFDKSAAVPRALSRAGFGFVECGTVTPRPQSGNPRPRLFRLAADKAVINRMGFNNDGLEVFAAGLATRVPGGVVGANVGANKESTDRAGDYGRLHVFGPWPTTLPSTCPRPTRRACGTCRPRRRSPICWARWPKRGRPWRLAPRGTGRFS